MFKVYITIILFAILQHVQCRPADAQTKSTASDQLHLFVANTSSSNNYHLGPIMSRINNFEDDINENLRALLPFLNFMFNTDSDSEETEEDDSCADQMVIELVPDHIEEKDISENREEFEDNISGTKESSQYEDSNDEELKINKGQLDNVRNHNIPDSDKEELNNGKEEANESIKESNATNADNFENPNEDVSNIDNKNSDEEANVQNINPAVEQV